MQRYHTVKNVVIYCAVKYLMACHSLAVSTDINSTNILLL